MTAETIVKHTELSVLSLLRERHAATSGNGPEWAYMEHVRNGPGFKANRTLDAMAVSLWPSRGMEIHGYEVKVSRADFRRELADGAKADTWHGIVDRFWIVAPRGVVPVDELPAAWGLIEVSTDGTKLRSAKAAPLLTDERAPITRDRLVPILRAAGAGMTVTPNQAAVTEARDRGFRDGVESARNSGQRWEDLCEEQAASLAEARRAVREIEEVIGVSLHDWRKNVDRIGLVRDALKAVLGDDEAVERARSRAQQAAADLERAAEHLTRQADWVRRECGGAR